MHTLHSHSHQGVRLQKDKKGKKNKVRIQSKYQDFTPSYNNLTLYMTSEYADNVWIGDPGCNTDFLDENKFTSGVRGGGGTLKIFRTWQGNSQNGSSGLDITHTQLRILCDKI